MASWGYFAFSPQAGFAKRRPSGESVKETLYAFALGSRSPWAKRPTSPGSAPAEDQSRCLKKNSGGTGQRGQLERCISAPGAGRRRPPRLPQLHRPLPRGSARAAALKTWGVLARSGRQVHATAATPPPPRSGGVAWRGGGSKSPLVSNRSDRSPNSCLSPGARGALQSRAPGWHAALPWIRRRLRRLPRGLGPPFSPKPHTRRTHQATVLSLSHLHQWLLLVLGAVGFGALPTFFLPSPPAPPSSGPKGFQRAK